MSDHEETAPDGPPSIVNYAIRGPKPPSSNKDGHRISMVNTHGFFTLIHADAESYLDQLKSDIFQVQMRVDAFNRRELGMRGGRAAARSRLHTELDTMKNSTDKVDSILRACPTLDEKKCKLLELLDATLVQYEYMALLATEKYATTSGIGPNGNANPSYGGPSPSRLPTHTNLVDRLMDLQANIDYNNNLPTPGNYKKGGGGEEEQTTGGGGERPNTNENEDPYNNNNNNRETCLGDNVRDMLEEMEDQIRLMEAELGMPLNHNASAVCDDGSAALLTVNHLYQRLKSACLNLEVVRERGVRHMQKEIEESQNTTKSIATLLDKSRAALASKDTAVKELREATVSSVDKYKETVKGLEVSMMEQQQRYTELERHKQQMEEELRRCQQEHEDAKQRHEVAVVQWARELEQERNLSAQSGEQCYEEMAAAQEQHQHLLKGERQALAEAKVQLASSQAELAQEIKRNLLERGEMEAEKGKERAEMEKLILELQAARGSLEGTEKQLVAAQDRNTALERGDGAGAGRAASEEAKAAGEEVSRVRKQLQSCELYYKHLCETQLDDMKRVQQENKQAKAELQRSQQAIQSMEELYAGQVASLKQTLEGGAAVNNTVMSDMFREEMRVMKGVYEVKLNTLKEEITRKDIDTVHHLRGLETKWAEERRVLEREQQKLRMRLEANGK